ncbi:MAG: hypothetical protein ACLQQ4_17765 [Bacteroidia bacterium]
MNRKTILLVTFVLAFIMLKAQDYVRPTRDNTSTSSGNPIPGNKKFSIGISIGEAIPMQDFGSTNVKNSFWDFTSPDSTRLQGFATTGFHFNISASYLFSDDFGIMMLIGFSSNSFDINAFSSSIGYPASNTTGGYSTAEYLIGPYLSLPVVNKLKINISALIGLVTSSYPTLNIALNDTTVLETNFNGGSGFAYSFSAGLEYSVNNNISLLLNFAYTETTITYSSWLATYTITGYYPVTINHNTDVTSMSTGILKPTIGISFKF